MAKRHFPAHARVADDLACIGCGYNLRTLMANANCPECGLEVGRSLFVLAKPRIVAEALRSVGITHLAVPIMLLTLLPSSQAWPIIVAFTVIAFSSAWRLIGIGHMHFRGAIIRLPVIGPGLRMWFVVAIVDCLAALTALGIILWLTENPLTPTGSRALRLAMFACLSITMFSPIVAAMFGSAMARLLGYQWIIVEFSIFRVVAVAGFIASILLATASFIGGGNLSMIFRGLLVVIMAASIIFSWIALTHLGNAADETSETWEDLIDSDRVEVLSQPPPRTRPREPSTVQLSPQRAQSVSSPTYPPPASGPGFTS